MISLSHAAVWVQDLEGMKTFYERYFGARANAKYSNESKGFESYFLTFDSGARLEIMRKEGVAAAPWNTQDPSRIVFPDHLGYAHLAFSVGSERAVKDLTERMEREGVHILSAPRRTGDGYYESLIADPEGNCVEITA